MLNDSKVYKMSIIEYVYVNVKTGEQENITFAEGIPSEALDDCADTRIRELKNEDYLYWDLVDTIQYSY